MYDIIIIPRSDMTQDHNILFNTTLPSIILFYFNTFSASDKNPDPVMLSNKLSSITMSSLSSKAPCTEQNIKINSSGVIVELLVPL